MSERAGVWIRVSSGGQDEANQLPDIERHVAAHGYQVAKRYTVHAKSASKGHQQPWLDQVLADMRARVIDVLIIWHSDRIERRPGKALLDLLAEVSAAGGRVESVQEPALGQLDFGSQVVTFIAGLVNHEKSAHLAEQIGLARDRIAANGGLDGKPPWGFITSGTKYNRRLIPTEEARQYIPMIYRRITSGESCAAVARWLESEGVEPAGIAKTDNANGKSGQWWPRSIWKLVKNPVYMGTRVDANGQTVTEAEQLVDPATWAAAGKALAGRGKRGPVLKANRCPLSGASRCYACGGPLYRIGPKDGPRYLRCSGTGPDRKSCGAAMIRLEVAEALADEVIGSLLIPCCEFQVIPGNGHAVEAELAALDFERKQLALRGLSWDAEESERAALKARYDAVAATEVIADKRLPVPTGESYGDRWTRLGTDERAAWLRSGEFMVMFLKGEIEGANATRDGVALVLHWTGEQTNLTRVS